MKSIKKQIMKILTVMIIITMTFTLSTRVQAASILGSLFKVGATLAIGSIKVIGVIISSLLGGGSSGGSSGETSTDIGKIQKPVDVPGDYVSNGYSLGHTAIDITASGIKGKSIKAAQSGKVIHASTTEHSSCGYYIVIEHTEGNNKIHTYYEHCQKGSLKVSTGDRVSRGDTIAKVGDTGNTTGAHLHFMIKTNCTAGTVWTGTAVNPLDYMSY